MIDLVNRVYISYLLDMDNNKNNVVFLVVQFSREKNPRLVSWPEAAQVFIKDILRLISHEKFTITTLFRSDDYGEDVPEIEGAFYVFYDGLKADIVSREFLCANYEKCKSGKQ